MAAAVGAAAVPALPFATSGSRVRSGYELVRTAASAGVVSGFVGRTAVVALAVLPLLAAGASVAASLRRRWAVATLTGMAGIVAFVAGAVVWRAPLASTDVGAPASVAVGLVAVGAAAAVLIGGREGEVRPS